MKRYQSVAKTVALLLMLGSIPVAVAQVAPGKPMAISEYAWPAETSPEPKDEEWAGAQQLQPLRVHDTRGSSMTRVSCTPKVVREWMQVTCECPREGGRDVLFGVLWGMAGDFSTVKSRFKTVTEVGRDKTPIENDRDRLQRKMGAENITTFQLKPGTAFVAQLDEIFWWDNYEGWHVGVREGPQIDMSWALGEKSPTVVLK